MTAVIGIAGMAFIFGLFAVLRPRESVCNGQCAGCTRDGACEKEGGKP